MEDKFTTINCQIRGYICSLTMAWAKESASMMADLKASKKAGTLVPTFCQIKKNMAVDGIFYNNITVDFSGR